MGSITKAEVSERFAEMERMDRNRVWEAAVSPLASPKPAMGSDTVEILIARFNEMDRNIASLRKDLQVQMAAVSTRHRRAWLRFAVIAIAAGVLGFGVPRLIAMLRPPAVVHASPLADEW